MVLGSWWNIEGWLFRSPTRPQGVLIVNMAKALCWALLLILNPPVSLNTSGNKLSPLLTVGRDLRGLLLRQPSNLEVLVYRAAPILFWSSLSPFAFIRFPRQSCFWNPIIFHSSHMAPELQPPRRNNIPQSTLTSSWPCISDQFPSSEFAPIMLSCSHFSSFTYISELQMKGLTSEILGTQV